MRLVILTNIVSPHVMPLARSLVELLGEEHVRYVAEEGVHPERADLGWDMDWSPTWVIVPRSSSSARASADACCREAPVLLCGYRDVALFEARARKGLHSYYFSERWFKPPQGAWRVLHPAYLRMSLRLVRLLLAGRVTYLPIGVHAARDMLRLVNLLGARPWRAWRSPAPQVQAAKPMAGVLAPASVGWIRLWGYFVEPSALPARAVRQSDTVSQPLRLLWLGRMLDWKRGETLVQAAVNLLEEGRSLQVVFLGYGPEEARWREHAGRHLVQDHGLALDGEGRVSSSRPGVFFQKPVPIDEVRRWLRAADVMVLTSDGAEGWGAVVSEAMAEDVCVVATRQAVSSATIVQDSVTGLLYDAGCVEQLTQRLRRCMGSDRLRMGKAARDVLEQHWAPSRAARLFLEHALPHALNPTRSGGSTS